MLFRSFVKGALTGNMGRSFVYNVDAIQLIFQRLPATLELAIAALLIAVLVGVPLGLFAGLKPENPIAKLATHSTLCHDRGLSSDTAIFPGFAVEQTLQAIKASGLPGDAAVSRVASRLRWPTLRRCFDRAVSCSRTMFSTNYRRCR